MADEAVVTPEASAPEAGPTLTEQMQKGLEDSGLARPKAKTETTEVSKADGKAAPPKPPPTQETLSAGFAKLERQRKSVNSREEAIKQAEARLTEERTAWERTHAETTEKFKARESEAERLLKLFDEDEEQFLTEVAKRRNKTPDDFYDRLTRRRLNGGVKHPDDVANEVKGELDAVKSELAKEREERAAREKAAKEENDKLEAAKRDQARMASEDRGFLTHITSNQTKYPLLALESPEDIAKTARAVVGNQKNVTFDTVAAHIEKQLAYLVWQEKQAAADAEPDEEPEPAPVKRSDSPKAGAGKPAKTEAKSQPKTLSNNLASLRTGSSHKPPKDENERLERALASAGWDK